MEWKLLAKNRQHGRSAATATQNDDGGYKVLRLRPKMPFMFGKRWESIELAARNDLRRFCRHARMLESATPAIRKGEVLQLPA